MKLNLSILLVSGDHKLVEPLKLWMSEMDQEIGVVDSVDAFEDEYTSNLDLCLIDTAQGRDSALEFSRRLREVHPFVGLVCINPNHDQQTRIQSWKSGADHVISQPLEPQEFQPMIQQLIRRLQVQVVKPNPLAPEPYKLELSTQKRSITGPSSEQFLTSTEYLLLQSLARARNKSLELWQIYDLLGKNEETLQKPAIEAQLYRLRKKLRDCGAGNQALKSVRLKGYQLLASIWIS